MSIIDKALAAITPPETEKARAEAAHKARAAASPGDWLSLALDHHDQIRAAFEACRTAQTPSARIAAMKALALILTGHVLAEEVAIYPAMAKSGDKGHASQAYAEQTMAKLQMAELERIDPAKDAWLEKLEHIKGAVLHHVYEEENGWFVDLRQKYDDQATLTARYREEFERYMGGPSAAKTNGHGAAEERSATPTEPPSEPRTIV